MGMEETASATAQKCPPVRVHAPDVEGGEWFACCTETVWLHAEQRLHQGCNWYGAWRATELEAKADAARHRRAHRALYSAVA